jgi:hypothetical protein
LVACCVIGSAQAARAQDFGIRGGASVDPDQAYIGAHANVGPLGRRVWFRPNLELGIGDDVTLTSLNFEFVYRHPVRNSPWTLYGGGGPAINIYKFERDTDAEAGFNIVGGVEHANRVFFEVKFGIEGRPDLKIGVGVTFR